MEDIKYIGINLLDGSEKEILDNLSAEYYDKIKRSIRNITSLVIHIKTHRDKPDKKTKVYSVHMRAVAPTKIFESSAHDWDFARTLHMAFQEMEKVVQHRFHSDASYKREYEK